MDYLTQIAKLIDEYITENKKHPNFITMTEIALEKIIDNYNIKMQKDFKRRVKNSPFPEIDMKHKPIIAKQEDGKVITLFGMEVKTVTKQKELYILEV